MRRLLAACLSLAVAGAPKVFGDEQSTSPYATAADFAKYAMKLREQALLKVEPQVFIPTSSRPATLHGAGPRWVRWRPAPQAYGDSALCSVRGRCRRRSQARAPGRVRK